MDNVKLKERAKGEVEFIYYRDGALWYVCNDGFKFPVPVPGDIGTASLLPRDKGLYFMRYIRKFMTQIEEAA